MLLVGGTLAGGIKVTFVLDELSGIFVIKENQFKCTYASTKTNAIKFSENDESKKNRQLHQPIKSSLHKAK